VTDQELLEKISTCSECPYCEHDDIERTDVDGGGTSLSAEFLCGHCNARWREYYNLVGAECLEAPDKSIVNPVGHARDMESALAKVEEEERERKEGAHGP
jgi:hypothetical protein